MLIGLVLLWFTRRQRAGKVCVTLGAVLLFAFSSSAVAQPLIDSLERQQPAYGLQGQFALPEEQIRYVVVLAGGVPAAEGYPVTRQVGAHSLARLVEAARVVQRCPNSRLVLSGGYGVSADTNPRTLTNYQCATLLGVPEERIITVNTSWDTEQEAANLRPLLGADPFVLVTEASHMPRAVALFEAQGLKPIPAPTDYRTGLVFILTPEAVFPNAESLSQTERAVYEYIGMLWNRLRGLK